MRQAAEARRVGRPRANPRRLGRPPEEEILVVAAKLFAERGFAATSTTEIARGAGLRQPSLFHYFPSKEAIFEAILDRSVRASLAFAERVLAETKPASVQLYRLARFDVRHLCSFPFDLGGLLSPEVRSPRFARARKMRERLIHAFETLLREGIASGEFIPVDARLATYALFGMGEWTLSWYRRGGEWEPDRVADEVASLAVRSLLRDPARLDEIRRDAAGVE